MKDLRLHIAECQGVNQDDIILLETCSTGVIVQFSKDIRGITATYHDDDEYCYFNTKYGMTEMYDVIIASDINKAIDIMMEINEKVNNE